jgi:predicted aldo/keto reductase-like oxidoreductase
MKYQDVTEYVEQALESGFTHIDTAASSHQPDIKIFVLLR